MDISSLVAADSDAQLTDSNRTDGGGSPRAQPATINSSQPQSSHVTLPTTTQRPAEDSQHESACTLDMLALIAANTAAEASSSSATSAKPPAAAVYSFRNGSTASHASERMDDKHNNDADDDGSGNWDDDDVSSPGRAGRGIPLPARTTRGMLAWLLEHHKSPFPSNDEKLEMQRKYNLTARQVSNWFINARRRILKKLELPSGPFTVTEELLNRAENMTKRGRRCRSLPHMAAPNVGSPQPQQPRVIQQLPTGAAVTAVSPRHQSRMLYSPNASSSSSAAAPPKYSGGQ